MGATLADPGSIRALCATAPASGFLPCSACAGTLADHSAFCPSLDAVEVATYLLALAAGQEDREDAVRQAVSFYVCDRLQMLRVAKLMAARGETCSVNPSVS